MSIEVEPYVFSGRENPTFELDAAETVDLVARVAAVMAAGGSPPGDFDEPLGYAGFAVTGDEVPGFLRVSGGQVIVSTEFESTSFPDVSDVEAMLLQAARDHGLGDLLTEIGIA